MNKISESRRDNKYKTLKKSKNPLSINEIAKFLNIPYGAAKQRLHKLEKWDLIKKNEERLLLFTFLFLIIQSCLNLRGNILSERVY